MCTLIVPKKYVAERQAKSIKAFIVRFCTIIVYSLGVLTIEHTVSLNTRFILRFLMTFSNLSL